MRIKKNIIRFTLMLAGLFLLTHAVLPHTHHDGIICFSHSVCHCDDHSTDLSHQATHHEHHDSDDCDLKQSIMRQGNSDDNTQFSFAADFLLLCCLGYHFSASHLDPPDIEQRIQTKPYLDSYTLPCVVSIRGLRAPPVSFLG